MTKHYDICELYDVLMVLSRTEAGALLQAVALYRRTHTIMANLPRNVEQILGGEIAKIRAAEDHFARVSISRRKAIQQRWDHTNEYKCIQMNTNVKNYPPLSTPIHKTPEIAPKGALSAPPDGDAVRDFEQFWNSYGKKVGRRETLAVWKRLTKTDRAEALARVAGFVAANPDRQYRPDPVRWLRQRRWEDEIIPRNPTPSGGGKSQSIDGNQLFNQFGAKELC